jgi:uncharacterized protein (DUF433 family)
MTPLDWSKCPLVEIDPIRVSGRPVLKGTRMPVEDIIANYEYGVSIDEIAEQFKISRPLIKELLSYVERHYELARPIDKNVPYGTRQFLNDHQIETVDEHGWERISNGELFVLQKQPVLMFC